MRLLRRGFCMRHALQPRRWPDAKLLPGASRLVEHLHRHGVPMAIATSTSRDSFELKVSKHPDIARMCQVGPHTLSCTAAFEAHAQLCLSCSACSLQVCV
jgi:hypothetical protein